MKNSSQPLTLGLLVSLAVAFVVSWIPNSPVMASLALFTDPGAMRPWAFLTYPWAVPGNGNALFFYLLMGLWLWGIGGQLERATNARTYIVLWLGAALVHGLTYSVVAQGMKEVFLAGPGLPIAFFAVYLGGRYPQQAISFFGVIPMTMKIVAILVAVLTFFGYGTGAPMLGLAAAAPLALAWGLGSRQWQLHPGRSRADIKFERKKEAEFDQFRDEVRRREIEREEKERLRRLFESSLDDGDDSAKSR